MGKRVLGAKPEGKSPPGRPTRILKVIMDFKGVKWNDLALGREKLGGGGVCEQGKKIGVSKRGEIF